MSDLPDYNSQPDFDLNLTGSEPANPAPAPQRMERREPIRPAPRPLNPADREPTQSTPAPIPPVQPSAALPVTPVPLQQDDDDSDGVDEVSEDEDSEALESVSRYRGATNDPAFGYLLALAVAVGLSPLIGEGQAELRYTIAWGALAAFGVIAWLFGNTARIEQEKPENIIWGIIFGLILSIPLVAFGGSTLSAAVKLLFGMMSTGTLLAYLLFVIPLAETLFFRGLMQEHRQFWMIGLMGALWSVILFAPLLDLFRFPFVAVVICTVLTMMSVTFSYVRQRNGLAAAWVCQIVVNLLLVFVPFII